MTEAQQQEIEAPAVPCDQFICFFDIGVGGDAEDDRYPVGVGKTRDEAFQMGIRNALPHVAEMGVLAAYNSGFVTIAQPQLTADEFATVGKVVADFFAGRMKLKTTASPDDSDEFITHTGPEDADVLRDEDADVLRDEDDDD